jgi:hypothetical protein
MKIVGVLAILFGIVFILLPIVTNALDAHRLLVDRGDPARRRVFPVPGSAREVHSVEKLSRYDPPGISPGRPL